MFDKIKQKLSSDSDATSTAQPNQSPSINEPSSTTSPANTTPSNQESRLSVSEDNDRGRRASLQAPSNPQSRRGSKSRSRSRARDVLWKTSLFDSSNPQGNAPKDPNLRAKSLSVAAPHPTMAEEGMRGMPYGDWSRKY